MSAGVVVLDEQLVPGAAQYIRAMCTCSYTLNGAAVIKSR